MNSQPLWPMTPPLADAQLAKVEELLACKAASDDAPNAPARMPAKALPISKTNTGTSVNHSRQAYVQQRSHRTAATPRRD